MYLDIYPGVLNVKKLHLDFSYFTTFSDHQPKVLALPPPLSSSNHPSAPAPNVLSHAILPTTQTLTSSYNLKSSDMCPAQLSVHGIRRHYFPVSLGPGQNSTDQTNIFLIPNLGCITATLLQNSAFLGDCFLEIPYSLLFKFQLACKYEYFSNVTCSVLCYLSDLETVPRFS